MRTIKKLRVLLILLALQCTPLGWVLVRAEEPEENLQFCVDGGKIYFFQPRTGRIFVYHTGTYRFNRLLTLEKLGEDLTQSRSLSIIEIEEERED